MKHQPFLIAFGMLTVLLVAGISYYSYSISHQLQEVMHTLDYAQRSLDIARDSLMGSQQTIQQLIVRLNQSDTQLRLVRSRVELIDLKQQKEKSESREKLQWLASQVRDKEAAIAALQEEAAKFPE